VAKVNDIDEALIAQVVERLVVDVEVVFGHDPEGADGGQRTAILAIQLVYTVTINDQLALLSARQVEVVHQAVARIVVVPVALVVHARPSVAVFTRITPSSVRHRPSLLGAAAWVVREDALAVTARGGSGKRSIAGALRCGVQSVVVWESKFGPSWATDSGFSPRADTTQRGRSRPKTASDLIRPTPGRGKCPRQIAI
jgi:hypothetical protein